MENSDFTSLIERSKKIRARYHELELQHHGSEWTVEEDALAFLTDAGLVGRHNHVAVGTLAGKKHAG